MTDSTLPADRSASVGATPDDASEVRLEELAGEFLDRVRRGESPRIDDYVAQHADLAAEIADLFPTIARIEGLKGESGSSSARRAVIGLPQLKQLGDFRIIREVGRGGMGVVFEAEQITLRRRVALKVLGANMAVTDRQLARFRREAEAAARLHHTNIVPVYGTGEDRGVSFFAMQYVDGWPLSDVIAKLAAKSGRSELHSTDSALTPDLSDFVLRRDPQPVGSAKESLAATESSAAITVEVGGVIAPLANPRHAAQLGADLARAVSYAHLHGVLHRDLKPSNILVDREGVGWLVDFGLARQHSDSTVTLTGDTVGTLQYMAPEQLRGEFDERSDVYALGLTLYELLSQTAAYEATPQAVLIHQKLSQPPRPLRTLVPQIARDLETIVMKACAHDPAHRYQTAAELAADLERFGADEPIHARRVTLIERWWRWAKRNRTIAALSALTLVLLLGVIAAFAIGNYRTNQALARVDEERKRVDDERKVADAERHRAQGNLNVAISVIDEVMENVSARGVPRTLRLAVEGAETQVSDSALTAADGELLRSLLQFYDRFAADNGADLTAESAKALARIGDIESRLGRLDRSAEAFREASMRYEQLRQEFPDDSALTVAAASVSNQLGIVLAASGDVPGAVDAHKSSERMLESLPSGRMNDQDRFELAQTLILLGTVGARAGAREMFGAFLTGGPPGPGGPRHPPGRPPGEPRRPGERHGPPPNFGPPQMPKPDGPKQIRFPAMGPGPMRELPPMLMDLRAALTILKELTARSPENADFRLALAQAEIYAIEFEQFQPDSEAQGKVGEEAEGILRALVAENPDSPKYLYELAEALCLRSRLWNQVLSDERQRRLREAVTIASRLTDAWPQISAYQALAARAHLDLALSLRGPANQQEASELFAIARAIQKRLADENPTSAFYQVAWARMLMEWANWQRDSGDRNGAAESLREALEIADRSAPAWGEDRFFHGFLDHLRRRVEDGR